MHSAKLVAQTVPTLPSLDPEQFIAYVARVSNPQNQESHETAPRLLRYLIKHKHWSPFEMAHVVMEITTTRDIARQMLRHRSFSFQEFSQRYADPTDLGFAFRAARLQDDKNRQNSIVTDDPHLAAWWNEAQNTIAQAVGDVYAEAIERGIAKEQARAVLPEGMTVSKLYMAGSIRSWLHYCELRMGHGTQREHQQVARSAWGELVEAYPVLVDCLEVSRD